MQQISSFQKISAMSFNLEISLIEVCLHVTCLENVFIPWSGDCILWGRLISVMTTKIRHDWIFRVYTLIFTKMSISYFDTEMVYLGFLISLIMLSISFKISDIYFLFFVQFTWSTLLSYTHFRRHFWILIKTQLPKFLRS